MRDQVMSCFGSCVEESTRLYSTPEESKRARLRDKQLTRLLNKHHNEEMKKLKLLLLGTGESGKSTLTKQMKIIHINGFDKQERLAKILDIKRNVRDAILAISGAMQNLSIPVLEGKNQPKLDFVLREASNSEQEITDEFLSTTQELWQDEGVQNCFEQSHKYQLSDCAKYFLDKLEEIRKDDYIPSDQDILRCRAITTSIQNIEFKVPDAGNHVKFSVYDVGGQRGERKKWIQVFDSVVAILYVADASTFDQNLLEDSQKNRLLESLEIFEQVWNNRFLRNVSILLFINKIDILAEKIVKGRDIQKLHEQYPDVFPDYTKFTPSNHDKLEFMDSYPGGCGQGRKKSRSRPDIDPEVTKTAVYIKELFMKIARGDLKLKETVQPHDKDWHAQHTCEYYYTCAVDTNHVTKVLEGCRTVIIRKHLERFGII
ncbi:hypothetical protein LOTGIDRAFT_159974 [Lottia gigantea]|uniref:Guanine nucleotide-binding protein G(s) subunit alpha n=1 Tax=Lottia gigantea TaxID=225164 RepID=V4AP37_LOTGI|nr:hypothetical protein LOTGIDRAFT_159974 [Lottia gigantea]ESO96555.1 hypothetical protein LOTGIDRAFT_159974 [Lottia gigantea]